MADVVTGDTGSPQNNEPADDKSQQPNILSPEQVDNIVRKLNGQSAELRRAMQKIGELESKLANPSQEPDPKQTPKRDGDDLAAQQEALRREVAALKREKEQVKMRSLKAYVRQEVVDRTDASKAEVLIDHLMTRLGSRIALTPDEDGVVVKPSKDRDLIDQEVPFGSYLDGWLKSEVGQLFQKPVRTPQGTGVGSQGYDMPGGGHVLMGKTYAELMSVKASDPAVFYDFIRRHPAEFDKAVRGRGPKK